MLEEKQTDIQNVFFELIKKRIPSNLSFVEEIADVLEISYDSAYRRVRGDKLLNINELVKLGLHYQISVDSVILNNNSEYIGFRKSVIKPDNISFINWLNSIVNDLKWISEQKEKQIIYAAKDPPIWYHWNFPDIAAFKVFFWKKTLLQIPEFASKKFSLKEKNVEIQNIGRKMLNIAVKIPSIELWNEDTFNILLKQIEYYWVSGVFEEADDVIRLCDNLEMWVRHIEKQAELGFKFIYGDNPEGIENSFKLYENEVVLNDNTIIVKTTDLSKCYLTYNTLNLLTTTDTIFIESIHNYFKLLEKKSTLISSCASKERKRFFNKLVATIEIFKKKVILG